MASALIQTLQEGIAGLPEGGIVVGFSGGLDSTVLLHALASLAAVRARGLRALHVDHSLHAQSAEWSAHCKAFADRLRVPIHCVEAAPIVAGGRGLEGAARAARHAAFAGQLGPGEILALAHHADDQAETVLLKLLRGAGPEGLGAMRALRPFADGLLWRPLLELQRALLRDYARRNDLGWIEDPSNADTRLRRNFLRREILPRLRERWPDASVAIAHSARWTRAAADFVAQQARLALARLQGVDPATLRWGEWLDLPAALRDHVLRLWLRSLQLAEPAHFHVAEVERQLREAAGDRTPCVRWDGCEVRRYRDLLYAQAPPSPIDAGWQATWDGMAPLALPGGGALRWQRDDEDDGQSTPDQVPFSADTASTPEGDAPLPERHPHFSDHDTPSGDNPAFSDGDTPQDDNTSLPTLTVRYRRGGEHIRPHDAAHTRELRTLLQEAGVPPWQRDRIPLVLHEGNLLMVGDLFVSVEGRDLFGRLQARIAWQQQ